MNSYKDTIQLLPYSAYLLARINMPQVSDLTKFEEFLYENRVDFTHLSNHPVCLLKPTQFDFDQSKVDHMIANGIDKPIVVSEDMFVLDGHHRYHAAKQTDIKIDILLVNLPINKLLRVVMEFIESND